MSYKSSVCMTWISLKPWHHTDQVSTPTFFKVVNISTTIIQDPVHVCVCVCVGGGGYIPRADFLNISSNTPIILSPPSPLYLFNVVNLVARNWSKACKQQCGKLGGKNLVKSLSPTMCLTWWQENGQKPVNVVNLVARNW